MSLKSDFDIEVSKLTRFWEVDLFRAFKNALIKQGAYVKEYHGSKGYVQYDSPCRPSFPIKCEICDLLLVFVGDKEIRYTFMQNKRCLNATDTNVPCVDTRQHYLLSALPVINPLGTPFMRDVLSSAKTPGVGSYGVFNKDIHGYDMKYYVARTLIPKNIKYPPSNSYYHSMLKKRNNKAYFNSYLDDEWFGSTNGVLECPHASNLDSFEKQARRMMIGTPLSRNDFLGNSFVFSLLLDTVGNNQKIFRKIRTITEKMDLGQQQLGIFEQRNDAIKIHLTVAVMDINESEDNSLTDLLLGLNTNTFRYE